MNSTQLSASIFEIHPLRYTPSGLPVVDLRLEHQSQTIEAQLERKVNLSIKAIAVGVTAERLSCQPLGSRWVFCGFLCSPKNGKSITLHIQEFQQI